MGVVPNSEKGCGLLPLPLLSFSIVDWALLSKLPSWICYNLLYRYGFATRGCV